MNGLQQGMVTEAERRGIAGPHFVNGALASVDKKGRSVPVSASEARNIELRVIYTAPIVPHESAE